MNVLLIAPDGGLAGVADEVRTVSALLRARKLVAIQAQARVSAFEGASHYSVWIDGSIEEILSEFAAKPWWKFW